MSLLTLFNADVEATGHPTECSEPAPGTVEKIESSSVSINGTGVATLAKADMVFPSHAHAFNPILGCHQKESHTVDPTRKLSSVSINSNPVYVSTDDVRDDPTTGDQINIVNTNGNSSVRDTQV